MRCRATANFALPPGMDDYISKPVNERDLKAVIERATQAGSTNSEVQKSSTSGNLAK